MFGFVRVRPTRVAYSPRWQSSGSPRSERGAAPSEHGKTATGFRFGRPPFAVDLITSVQGVAFEEAWAGSSVRRLGGLEVRVIGRAALLANKRARGRPKDAADVEALEALAESHDG